MSPNDSFAVLNDTFPRLNDTFAAVSDTFVTAVQFLLNYNAKVRNSEMAFSTFRQLLTVSDRLWQFLAVLRLSEVFHDEPHLTRREALRPLAVVRGKLFILATCQPFSGVTVKMDKTIFENFYPCPPACVRVLEKGCQVARLPRRSDVLLVEHHLLGGPTLLPDALPPFAPSPFRLDFRCGLIIPIALCE